MNRYEEYKDSGVQWIGEIPSHWEVKRLKHQLKSVSGAINAGFKVGLENIESGTGRYIETESEFEGCGVSFMVGDLLFGKLRPYLMKVWIAEFDGLAVGDFFVYRAVENIDNRYAKYLLLSPGYVNIVNASTYGSKMPRVSSTFMNNTYIPIPPLPEQQAIVTYLDEKVGKIDACIEARKKEIDLLNESKKTIIADAVTHGLNPDAEMKDSGIPWIDRIPAHWEVKMLRNYLFPFSEKGHPQEQLLSVTRERGVIVRNAESKEENHNYIPDDLGAYKYIEKGDFVINKMKSWQGSYGLSDYQGIVSPAYYTCKLKNVCKEFFSVAVRSYPYISFFAAYSKGIRVGQWDLPIEALKMIPFIEPPLDEQRKIYDFIKSKTAKIDSTISYMQGQIEELKEYKQRLISDVVTGQKKVK